MAGKIKKHLEEIISTVSNGNKIVRVTTKTKLILRGLDPDRFNESSPDDQDLLNKVQLVAKEFNVTLKSL
jgi:hypothetical protein